MSKVIEKPVMIVVAGPNGSGKTSITKLLLAHKWFEGCEYINPDEIAERMFGGWNNEKAIIDAANYAESLRNEYIESRKSFIFETVLSHHSKVDFIKKAIEDGFFVRLLFVSTNSPSINGARITTRVMNGGHSVPIEKIISRFSKSIENGFLLASLVDRAYFYDNSIENNSPALLAKFVNGQPSKLYVDNLDDFKWIPLNTIKQKLNENESKAHNSIKAQIIEGDSKSNFNMSLVTIEGGFVSRSQSKSVTTRFEEFSEVDIDFLGVQEIGQAFADEMVRVWPLQHPGTLLNIINANEQVLKMISHVKSRKDLPQPMVEVNIIHASERLHSIKPSIIK